MYSYRNTVLPSLCSKGQKLPVLLGSTDAQISHLHLYLHVHSFSLTEDYHFLESLY